MQYTERVTPGVYQQVIKKSDHGAFCVFYIIEYTERVTPGVYQHVIKKSDHGAFCAFYIIEYTEMGLTFQFH